MRISLVIWIVLAILGLFGALLISSIFFGFFTVSSVLIIYNLTTEKQMSTTQTALPTASSITIEPTHTCPICGASLETEASFCTRCGEQVRKI